MKTSKIFLIGGLAYLTAPWAYADDFSCPMSKDISVISLGPQYSMTGPYVFPHRRELGRFSGLFTEGAEPNKTPKPDGVPQWTKVDSLEKNSFRLTCAYQTENYGQIYDAVLTLVVKNYKHCDTKTNHLGFECEPIKTN